MTTPAYSQDLRPNDVPGIQATPHEEIESLILSGVRRQREQPFGISSLVTRVNLERGRGRTYIKPHFGKFNADFFPETGELNQPQQLDLIRLVRIRTRVIGTDTIIPHTLNIFSQPRVLIMYGGLEQNAINRLAENIIITGFNATPFQYGQDGIFDLADLRAARTRLSADYTDPPMGMFYLVLHEFQAQAIEHQMIHNAVGVGGGNRGQNAAFGQMTQGLTADVWRRGLSAIQGIAGVMTQINNHIPVNSSNNAKALLFAREAGLLVDVMGTRPMGIIDKEDWGEEGARRIIRRRRIGFQLDGAERPTSAQIEADATAEIS